MEKIKNLNSKVRVLDIQGKSFIFTDKQVTQIIKTLQVVRNVIIESKIVNKDIYFYPVIVINKKDNIFTLKEINSILQVLQSYKKVSLSDLGIKLESKRSELDYTQKRVCKILGCCPNTYRRTIFGKTIPPKRFLNRINKFLGDK